MLPPAGAAPLAAVPENRAEALAAAQVMQERARLLRRISAEHLRHLARPFFAAGWSPRDLLHAIDHEPGGRQHGYMSGVRSPAGWIRSRLAAWSGPNGVPLPSRSQRLTEARRQVLADQAARRARDADARPGPRTTRRRPPGHGRCSATRLTSIVPQIETRRPRYTEVTRPAVPAFRDRGRRSGAQRHDCYPGDLETVHARMAWLPARELPIGRASSRVGELQVSELRRRVSIAHLLWQCHSATCHSRLRPLCLALEGSQAESNDLARELGIRKFGVYVHALVEPSAIESGRGWLAETDCGCDTLLPYRPGRCRRRWSFGVCPRAGRL